MSTQTVLAPGILYGVWASQGIYSDHGEWLVAVYAKEEAAKEHVKRAEEAITAHRKLIAEYDGPFKDEPTWYDFRSPWDRYEYLREDATYCVGAVFLHVDVDTFAEHQKVLEDLARERGDIT